MTHSYSVGDKVILTDIRYEVTNLLDVPSTAYTHNWMQPNPDMLGVPMTENPRELPSKPTPTTELLMYQQQLADCEREKHYYMTLYTLTAKALEDAKAALDVATKALEDTTKGLRAMGIVAF